MKINIKRMNKHAIKPTYGSNGAACFDLYACLDTHPKEVVPARKRVAIPTGWAFEIPEGYELQIIPRSGLALKEGVTVLNTPGCVDSDYRGEVMVILYNTDNWPYYVSNGERIAQAKVVPVPKVELIEVDELSMTERGAGGFGSTGKV